MKVTTEFGQPIKTRTAVRIREYRRITEDRDYISTAIVVCRYFTADRELIDAVVFADGWQIGTTPFTSEADIEAAITAAHARTVARMSL
jgi:hypothetical protein